MRSILRGALLFGVIAVLCAGLAFSVERGLTANKGELGRASVTTINSSATNAGHSARVKDVTREDILRFLNSTPEAGYVPNSHDSLRAERAVVAAEHLLKTGEIAEAKSLMPKVARSEQGAQVRPRLQALASEISSGATGGTGLTISENFGGSSGSAAARDALGSNCTNATLVTLPYSDVQDLPASGLSNWRAFTVAGPDPEEVVLSTFQSPNNDPFGDDTNLTLYGGCDLGTGAPLDEIAFNEDFGGTFLSEITECLAPGTYYVRVGGWLDLATWFGVEFDMFSTGTCFIPVPDEFEYDDQSSYANQIGCELLAVGDPVCFPCDDDSSDSSSYGWWDDDSDSSAALCCTQPEACLILQSQCRSIFPFADIDNVIFNVGPEPRWVTVETGASEDCGIADEPDTIMGLSSATGTLIAVNDDKPGVFAGGSVIGFCAPPDTDYILTVIGADVFDEFGYELSVTTSEEPCNIEVEPNGLCEDATPVPYSGAADNGYTISGTYNSGGLSDWLIDLYGIAGAIYPGDDWPILDVGELDYFTFTINEPCQLTVSSSSPDCWRSDNFMQVFSGCPGDASNFERSSVSGFQFCDDLTFIVEPGQQYWMLHTEQPQFINPVDYFPYTLEFTCVEPPATETEPNDTAIEGANNPLPLDEPIIGEVNGTPGDEYDYYCFTLDADTQFTLEVTGISTSGFSFDSVLALTDAAGNQICCDDDSGVGFLSEITACVPPGDYCVGIKDWGFPSQLEYELLFVDEGACAGGPTCIVADESLLYGECSPFQL